jgi:cytoskeleton protein RodZ
MSRSGGDSLPTEPLGIGETLRQAREARGLSLSQVAQETRIRAPFLLALEDEEFGELPAPIYARAFLRTYSHYLDLDTAGLLAALDEHHLLQSQANLVPAAARVASSESIYPRAVVPVVALAFLFGLVYFLYVQYSAFVSSQELVPVLLPTSVPAVAHRVTTPEPTFLPTVSPTSAVVALPTSSLPTATPPPSPTAARAGSPTAVGVAKTSPTAVGTVKAGPTALATPTATKPTPRPASPTVSSAASPAASPTPPGPPGTPTGNPGTVEARFSADCWVQATIDDQVVLNGVTVKAGENKVWTGRKFVIKFGNAGGVDLVLNGKPSARPGANGEVINWSWTAP